MHDFTAPSTSSSPRSHSSRLTSPSLFQVSVHTRLSMPRCCPFPPSAHSRQHSGRGCTLLTNSHPPPSLGEGRRELPTTVLTWERGQDLAPGSGLAAGQLLHPLHELAPAWGNAPTALAVEGTLQAPGTGLPRCSRDLDDSPREGLSSLCRGTLTGTIVDTCLFPPCQGHQ